MATPDLQTAHGHRLSGSGSTGREQSRSQCPSPSLSAHLRRSQSLALSSAQTPPNYLKRGGPDPHGPVHDGSYHDRGAAAAKRQRLSHGTPGGNLSAQDASMFSPEPPALRDGSEEEDPQDGTSDSDRYPIDTGTRLAWQKDYERDAAVEMPCSIEYETYYSDDDYPWDSDEILELLGAASLQDPVQPPSSVLNALDHGSRSVDEFDPDLQHSPPSPSSNPKSTAASPHDKLPPQEVDLEPVIRHSGERHERASLTMSLPTRKAESTGQHKTELTLQTATPLTQTPTPFGTMPLKPHKTFFHVKEMLEAKQQMFRNQPDAVFELFARVVYSSRVNFYRKQYFQFRDLFKEPPPYLSGALRG